jgi:hypothetical protein
MAAGDEGESIDHFVDKKSRPKNRLTMTDLEDSGSELEINDPGVLSDEHYEDDESHEERSKDEIIVEKSAYVTNCRLN